MTRFKSCPKCNGDLFAYRGDYGGYVQCLQCGYVGYTEATGQQWGPKEARGGAVPATEARKAPVTRWER